MTRQAWRQAARDAVTTGGVAAAATTLTVAACGALKNGDALAPINAISHIAWGDESLTARRFSVRHTLVGLALNGAASFAWALLFERFFGGATAPGGAATPRRTRHALPSGVPTGSALTGGALVAAAAYITDYHLVPPRLTPGFEKHLSRRSLLLIYVALALALACGEVLRGASPATVEDAEDG